MGHIWIVQCNCILKTRPNTSKRISWLNATVVHYANYYTAVCMYGEFSKHLIVSTHNFSVFIEQFHLNQVERPIIYCTWTGLWSQGDYVRGIWFIVFTGNDICGTLIWELSFHWIVCQLMERGSSCLSYLPWLEGPMARSHELVIFWWLLLIFSRCRSTTSVERSWHMSLNRCFYTWRTCCQLTGYPAVH